MIVVTMAQHHRINVSDLSTSGSRPAQVPRRSQAKPAPRRFTTAAFAGPSPDTLELRSSSAANPSGHATFRMMKPSRRNPNRGADRRRSLAYSTRNRRIGGLGLNGRTVAAP
jgi:hypothetical protein